MTELTDEQIAREEKFLEGIPRLNIGALFLPPIWAPRTACGPLSCSIPSGCSRQHVLCGIHRRTPLAIGIALIVLLTLTVGTVVFAILGQPFAAHRAASLGQDKETYLKRERIWTIASVIAGIAMIAAATYYNLVIRRRWGRKVGAARRIAVFCVGNKLMLDDGVGPAVYEELLTRYDIPDNVELFDLGCLSLNMIERVREYDVIITVDAVDGTDADPARCFASSRCHGAPFGGNSVAARISSWSTCSTPLRFRLRSRGPVPGNAGGEPIACRGHRGLTPKVDAALPLLVETVAGELARLGSPLRARA